MSILTTDPATSAAVDYCRRARRIRASFKQNPFLRHQALTDLAKKRDRHVHAQSARLAPVYLTSSQPSLAQQVTPRRMIATQQNQESSERDFIAQVRARLQPFGFTFSDRLKLLHTAEGLGINRFRANVIMAMHEHQAGRVQGCENAAPLVPPLLIVLAVEIAVVAMLVWACML